MSAPTYIFDPDLYRKLVVFLVNYFDQDDPEFGTVVIERLSKVPWGTEYTLNEAELPEGLYTDDDLAGMPDGIFVGFQVREMLSC